jgi:hypothetical protein
MKDAQGRALRWVVRSALSNEAELRDKIDVFGTLRRQPYSFTASANAETLGRRWEIWQAGLLWGARILIDSQRNNGAATVFRPRWLSRRRGGTLEPSELSFDEMSALRSRWEWRDEQNDPVVQFEGTLFWSGGCDVRIRQDAFGRSDLDLLVVLGFYYKCRMDAAS